MSVEFLSFQFGILVENLQVLILVVFEFFTLMGCKIILAKSKTKMCTLVIAHTTVLLRNLLTHTLVVSKHTVRSLKSFWENATIFILFL